MGDKFIGFDPPIENWSKLPHALIDALSLITSEAEAKVILYILRHTWGYHDENKRISNDEFSGGRRRKDGSRIDGGTGLSENAIKDGLRRAVLHGFIEIDTDAKDRGRIRNYYRLKMKEISEVDPPQMGYQTLIPPVSEVDTQDSTSDTRSEKDTSRNKQQKETEDMSQCVTISLSPARLHLRLVGDDGDYLSFLLNDLDIMGRKRREIERKRPRADFILAHALYAASSSRGAGWIITEILEGAVPQSDFLGFARLAPDEWRALWRGSTRGEWNTCPPQLYASRGVWLQAFDGIFESEPFIEQEPDSTMPEQNKLLNDEPEQIQIVQIEQTEWERIWFSALESLSLQLTTTTFDADLKHTRVWNEQCNGKLVIIVDHPRYGSLEWINGRLRRMIERAVKNAAGQEIEIEFVTREKK